MKYLMKRSRARRGETLVEILVAILIIALSAGLFAVMYNASAGINVSAQKQDKLFYAAVETLEEMIDKGEGTAVEGTYYVEYSYQQGGTWTELDGGKVEIEVFTEDGMSAYREKAAAGS